MSRKKGWFGPKKADVWRELSEKLGAEFIKGTWRRSDRVMLKLMSWTIMLDTYTVSTGQASITYTRLRAPFVNQTGFHFSIRRRGFFSDLGKKLGMQDLIIGIPAFDEPFIIKATDETALRDLFTNDRIRELIQQQKRIVLSIKDNEGWFGKKFPENVDELHFQVTGVIKDVERLENLFVLFAEVLNQLQIMGVAAEHDPEIEL